MHFEMPCRVQPALGSEAIHCTSSHRLLCCWRRRLSSCSRNIASCVSCGRLCGGDGGGGRCTGNSGSIPREACRDAAVSSQDGAAGRACAAGVSLSRAAAPLMLAVRFPPRAGAAAAMGHGGAGALPLADPLLYPRLARRGRRLRHHQPRIVRVDKAVDCRRAGAAG